MNIDINNTIHTNFCTFSFLFLVINNIYSIYHINNNNEKNRVLTPGLCIFNNNTNYSIILFILLNVQMYHIFDSNTFN